MSKIYSKVCLTLLFIFNSFLSLPMKKEKITAVYAKTATEGKAECVMEMNSRRILYAANEDIRLPMASTTKIATAITVLENCENLDEKFPIPNEAQGIEGSSVYLKAGDYYSVTDLLYGLMLRSGNDCATALAIRCSGDIKNFSAKMNETAQKAGALATNFQNPHGLPCKGHYTTAKDLTLISCYAMKNSTFAQIVSTRYYEPCHWQNKNKMLFLYDGGIGVKTGYTKEAGRCLVSAGKRENMTLVCTLLNCPTTYERSIQLLDDAFSAYSYTKVLDKESVFKVQSGNKEISCRAKEDCFYPLLKEEQDLIEVKTVALKEGKNKEIVGKYQIYLAKRLLFSGNLYIL